MFRRIADNTIILRKDEARTLYKLLEKEYINYQNPEAVRLVKELGILVEDDRTLTEVMTEGV